MTCRMLNGMLLLAVLCGVSKQVFRATDGQALVWGKKPEMIIAKYSTADGKEATSLLLASGGWCRCKE